LRKILTKTKWWWYHGRTTRRRIRIWPIQKILVGWQSGKSLCSMPSWSAQKLSGKGQEDTKLWLRTLS